MIAAVFDRSGAGRDLGLVENGIALHEDELVLTRRLLGGRPLYYAETRDAVVASSRLAAVVAALDAPPKQNVRKLARTTLLRVVPDDSETVHEGVSRVLCGQTVRFRRDGTRATRTAPLPKLEPLRGDAEELAVLLRAAIESAVKRAISGAHRVAIAAGGGLDSSGLLAALIATSRGAGGPEVVAIALDFAGPGTDQPHMRALSDALGIVPLRVKPADCGRHVRDALTSDAAPFAYVTAGWLRELTKQARDHGADLVLSGEGGDLLFDGDPRILARRALHGGILGALADAARLRVPWRSTALDRMRELVLGPMAASLVPKAIRRARARRSRKTTLAPWAGSRLRDLVDLPEREVGDEVDNSGLLGPRSPDDVFRAMAYSPRLLDVADMRGQLEAHDGVPRVDPYLDEELASFVARVPPEMMLHQHRLRGLFRLAFRGVLPESLRLRTDKASFEPAAREMLSAKGAFDDLRDLASMEALADLGIVDPVRYRVGFDRLASGAADGTDWFLHWPALAVEAFARGATRTGDDAATTSEVALPSRAC